jgi:hypothetical protein
MNDRAVRVFWRFNRARSPALLAACLWLAAGAYAEETAAPQGVPTPTETSAAPGHPHHLGPVQIGATVGALSLPRPVNVQLFAKVYDLIGIGVSYSYLPGFIADAILSLYGVHNVSLTSSAWDVDLRLFILQGAFFLGSSLGTQSLTATATSNGVTARGDLTTVYVTPRLGWLFIWDSGFLMGTELGVQIPVSSTLTIDPAANNRDVREAARVIGQTPLPAVTFRIGYLF